MKHNEVMTRPRSSIMDSNGVTLVLRIVGSLLMVGGTIKEFVNFKAYWIGIENPWAMFWFGLYLFTLSYVKRSRN